MTLLRYFNEVGPKCNMSNCCCYYEQYHKGDKCYAIARLGSVHTECHHIILLIMIYCMDALVIQDSISYKSFNCTKEL